MMKFVVALLVALVMGAKAFNGEFLNFEYCTNRVYSSRHVVDYIYLPTHLGAYFPCHCPSWGWVTQS